MANASHPGASFGSLGRATPLPTRILDDAGGEVNAPVQGGDEGEPSEHRKTSEPTPFNSSFHLVLAKRTTDMVGQPTPGRVG